MMQKKVLKLFSENKLFLIVLILGSLSWILTMVKSNLPYSFGIGFWGANGHDGIWHIALANSLGSGSFNMPVFAGVPLQNYHIGFDLILAALSKTGVPVSVWYFQVLPVVFSILIGALTYKLVISWRKNKNEALWAAFFVYFGGSFGWVVTLVRGQGFGGESMFWSQQAISTLINPPFALSLILILSALIVLQKYQAKQNVRNLIVASILFGIIIEIKAYAGVLILGGLLMASIYEIVTKKKIRLIKVFFKSLVISVLIFLPLNHNASSLFVFSPGWFLETMLGISDRFFWPKAYEALMNWKSGHVLLKELGGYFGAFVIFIIGNLGIRLVGSLSFIKLANKRQVDTLNLILVSIFLGGIVAPMLFLQKGTPWNTIQFFYYSLFVAAIYAGITIANLVSKFNKNKPLKVAIIAFVILLTIPTTFSTLLEVYLPYRAPAKISFDEANALSFLSTKPYGVVLTYPYDEFKAREAEKNPPRPLYLYDSTAYVSAFSDKPVFLEDQVNLTILNYDWQKRLDEINQFLKSNNQNFVRSFLKENKIKYIYWLNGQRAVLGETQLGIEKIFENKEVFIYEVKDL